MSICVNLGSNLETLSMFLKSCFKKICSLHGGDDEGLPAVIGHGVCIFAFCLQRS